MSARVVLGCRSQEEDKPSPTCLGWAENCEGGQASVQGGERQWLYAAACEDRCKVRR
jgi:hypothetical protein